MPVSSYIAGLRAHIGHDLLMLPSVSAVVRNDAGQVLLARRSDNGRWSLPAGVVDPGEQPAAAALREVFEETGVHCETERVVSVHAMREPITYPNGDVCQFMDITFACRAIGGEAHVHDEESTEVGWFSVDALPKLRDFALFRLKQALGDGPTWFEPATG